jgi:NADPH-dependent curcumin reductase CurA
MQSNPMSNLQIKLTALPSDKYPLDNKEVFQTITSNRPTKSQVPNNHVLVKVLSLSVDAANRLWISGQKSYRDPVPIGSVMDGLGVG